MHPIQTSAKEKPSLLLTTLAVEFCRPFCLWAGPPLRAASLKQRLRDFWKDEICVGNSACALLAGQVRQIFYFEANL